MTEFTYQVTYTSRGDVTVEADTETEAFEEAKDRLRDMHDGGAIATDREFISWSSDEVELDGVEL
jgi:hypothetical protein